MNSVNFETKLAVKWFGNIMEEIVTQNKSMDDNDLISLLSETIQNKVYEDLSLLTEGYVSELIHNSLDEIDFRELVMSYKAIKQPLTPELIEYLENRNGKLNTDRVQAEFRCYYVIKEKKIENAFLINKDKYTLAEANKITKELMAIMYDDSFQAEYTGQIVDYVINPKDYTAQNQYLKYSTGLYIV